MRIAVVGAGVAGLVAARGLHAEHEVSLFEARDRLGGHVRTVEVGDTRGPARVDTGFIVYNEPNYPVFSRILRELGVRTQPSTMSFSVRLDDADLEYNGSTLRQLFADRRNLFRPGFYRMLGEIVRFNRLAPVAMRDGGADTTLGDLLEEHGFSEAFSEHYLLPMGAAIWSSPTSDVLSMPAWFFIRFFENHGMLTIDDRPEWRVVAGGSRRYVDTLVEPFRDRVRLGHPVEEIQRGDTGVSVDGERFDEVVLACHGDQALAMLADPSDEEAAILGAFRFQPNEVVLHTDTSLLPRRRRAWAAWNYHSSGEAGRPVSVTYNMNHLQSLETEEVYCVTLNDRAAIDPARIIESFTLSHPIFTPGAVRAQARHGEINGTRRTSFCGAYWRYGFHEDGAWSAERVIRKVGVPA